MSQPAVSNSNALQPPSLRQCSGLACFLKSFVHGVLILSAMLLTLYFLTHPEAINLAYLPWCLMFDLVVLAGFAAAVGFFLRYSSPNRPSQLHSPMGYSVPLFLSLRSTRPSPVTSVSAPYVQIAPPILIPVNAITDHTPLIATNVPVSLHSSQQLSVHTTQYHTISMDMSPCCVCLDSLTNKSPVVALQCSHRFHECCILDWFKRKRQCPVCRFGT